MAITEERLDRDFLPRNGYANDRQRDFLIEVRRSLGFKRCFEQASDNTSCNILDEKHDYAILADFTYSTGTLDGKVATASAEQRKALEDLCDAYGFTYTLDGL